MAIQKGSKKTNTNKSKDKPDLLVTGDTSMDRFIYLEDVPDNPANLRDAWVDAKRFWRVDLDGGGGNLIQYLKAAGIKAVDPCPKPEEMAESIYILTRGREKKEQNWCVGQAITAGEHEYPSGELEKCAYKTTSDNMPVVIVDYNQGWLLKNKDAVKNFLGKRHYIVRTHDPLSEDWKSVRKQSKKKGIWFSPLQDIANSSLEFPGNWESMRERLLNYLQTDNTIWQRGGWQQYVVIQISYDGALVVGPGIPEEGKLFIYKGDQPGSFLREGYGTVVAGGIVFVYSLTQALLSSASLKKKDVLECSKKGLARIREVVKKGYVGPKDEKDNWTTKTTNLPVTVLEKADVTNIIAYNKPPTADLKTASEIVCCSSNELRAKTVFSLGKLLTSSPDYADMLLRLTSRVEAHVNNGKDVLSFSIFGGPGSGKSFIAEQIAKSVDDPVKSKFEFLSYNISQFDDNSRLVNAFKEIQTASAKGKIPFVLWDEFDTTYKSEKAGWISSFLMPMQDGEFFDGMSSRGLGKCIFVFIGGTFKDDPDFNEWASSEEGRNSKGPDFHSRLSSSLTVPSVEVDPDLKSTDNPALLVRAVLVRTFLEKHKKLNSISRDVLAFLLCAPLEHGVRSLEKIISASELSKTAFFDSIHLPSLDVLQLHIDGSNLSDNGSISRLLRYFKITYRQDAPLKLEWNKKD